MFNSRRIAELEKSVSALLIGYSDLAKNYSNLSDYVLNTRGVVSPAKKRGRPAKKVTTKKK